VKLDGMNVSEAVLDEILERRGQPGIPSDWQVGIDAVCQAIRERRLSKKQQRSPRNISPSLRFDIIKRDGYRCQICGRSAQDGVRLEIDHKHPVSRGGNGNKENLWTLCYECNIGKGAKSLT